MQQVDRIEIEILDNGTVKLSTDKIGAGNHTNAAKLFAEIANMMGGKTTSERKAGHGHHHHHHGHTHHHENKA